MQPEQPQTRWVAAAHPRHPKQRRVRVDDDAPWNFTPKETSGHRERSFRNYTLPPCCVRHFHTDARIFNLIKLCCVSGCRRGNQRNPAALLEAGKTFFFFLLVIVLYHKHIPYYRSAYSSITVYFPSTNPQRREPLHLIGRRWFSHVTRDPSYKPGRAPNPPLTSYQYSVGSSLEASCRRPNAVETWWVNYTLLVLCVFSFTCSSCDFEVGWWQIGQSCVEFSSIFWGCHSWEIQNLCHLVLDLHVQQNELCGFKNKGPMLQNDMFKDTTFYWTLVYRRFTIKRTSTCLLCYFFLCFLAY